MGYCIYLRKSRKDMELERTGEMETLRKHEDLLTSVAERQGLKIDKVYRELVSGESIRDRPQMQRLLDDVMVGKYEGVLVTEVERLSRGNARDQGRIAEAFKFTNTKVVTPIKTYDPEDEIDEEFFEFALFMSRKEFKAITRRLQNGILLSIQKGNWHNIAPFGYDIDQRGRGDRTLKPNDNAKYVEMIFTWYADDKLTPKEIAEKLVTMGVRTQRGTLKWASTTIKQILRNVVYLGKVRWKYRPTKMVMENGEMVKRRRLDEDCLIFEGKHPAIISPELFERTMRRIKQRSAPVPNGRITNPLGGLLKCSRCGYGLSQYQPQRGRARLQHRRMDCKVRSSAIEVVLDATIQGLKMHIQDFEFKMTNEYEIGKSKRVNEEIESIKGQLKKLHTRRENQYIMREDGEYTKEEFLTRRAEVDGQIKELQTKLDELNTSVTDAIDYQERIRTFSDVIEKLKDQSVSAGDKNNLLKDILQRIEYSNEDGKVTLDLILR